MVSFDNCKHMKYDKTADWGCYRGAVFTSHHEFPAHSDLYYILQMTVIWNTYENGTLCSFLQAQDY